MMQLGKLQGNSKPCPAAGQFADKCPCLPAWSFIWSLLLHFNSRRDPEFTLFFLDKFKDSKMPELGYNADVICALLKKPHASHIEKDNIQLKMSS